jgi:cell division septation protein DedD
MERRQAVVLLVILLVASLASFVVGIFVGSHGSRHDRNEAQQIEEVVIDPSTPVPLAQPVPERPQTQNVKVASADVSAETAQEVPTELTFYDDLSTTQPAPAEPLGSGINVEPAPKVKPPIPLAEEPIIVTQTPVVVVPQPSPEPIIVKQEPKAIAMPKSSATGTHAVQVGSFGASKDAIKLKEKLLSKQYPAYMVEADLGSKGLWYRVKIGPYVDSATAEKAQQALLQLENIKGFVSRK